MRTRIHHKKSLLILLCAIVSQFAYHQTTKAQPETGAVLRGGIDVLDYATTKNSGSFAKELGYTFGYLRDVGLATNPENPWAVLLGIELNYAHSVTYRSSAVHQYIDFVGTHQDVFDEKYDFSSIELGLSIEPCRTIGKDMVIGYYVGGSVGLGLESFANRRLSSVIIDTKITDPTGGEGPYGKSSSFIFPIGIYAGLNYSYKRLMVDLRYKFIPDVNDDNNSWVQINVGNVYFQIGIVLF